MPPPSLSGGRESARLGGEENIYGLPLEVFGENVKGESTWLKGGEFDAEVEGEEAEADAEEGVGEGGGVGLAL